MSQAIAAVERAIICDPNLANVYATLARRAEFGWVGQRKRYRMAGAGAAPKAPGCCRPRLSSIGTAYYPSRAALRTHVAPLKQFLARYPNILGVHGTLAAVYSELGKEAEAHAEAAEVLRLNPKFSLEVHKERAPIKDPAAVGAAYCGVAQGGAEVN